MAAVEVAKKPIPPRPPPVESKPILAGRLWIVVALLGGLGLIANPRFNEWVMINLAPPEEVRTDFTKWKLGGETELRVTLITADASRLDCAHAQSFEGTHCRYGGDKLPWPKAENAPVDDNAVDIIQPYRTSPDNALLLLAGLWAQPDVAMRLHREPPGGVQAKRLGRFDVTCRVKFIGRFDDVQLRWDNTPQTPWQPERGAWVAKPISCTVNNS
jgi:hypothetical protein